MAGKANAMPERCETALPEGMTLDASRVSSMFLQLFRSEIESEVLGWHEHRPVSAEQGR